MTKIFNEKSPNLKIVEKLFEDCFKTLKGDDDTKFTEDNNLGFREYFDIDNLKDYLKYADVLIAKDSEKNIGGIIIGKQNPLSYPDGKKFEVFLLGVLPKYRNKGIGELLMTEGIKLARNKGAKAVILNTHELMLDTQKYYLDMGFEKIGTLKEYYGNGNAVFFMKKI